MEVDWHDLKEDKPQPEAQDTETEHPVVEPQLNGYVECRGRVFKIESKEDLFKVLAYCDGYSLNKEDNNG